jgi:hypothetical protein
VAANGVEVGVAGSARAVTVWVWVTVTIAGGEDMVRESRIQNIYPESTGAKSSTPRYILSSHDSPHSALHLAYTQSIDPNWGFKEVKVQRRVSVSYSKFFRTTVFHMLQA